MQNLIDVSKNNGQINWSLVATYNTPKIDGVIIKATEGATVRDKNLWTNIEGCVKNNLPWGAYHFATWNNEDEAADATAEANFFLAVIKGQKYLPTLPLVLDIESNKVIPYTKDEMVLYVKTFTEIIKNAGFEVAIYSSPGFLNSYLPANHPFVDLKLWVADYTGEINSVPGWKKYWMRQYSDKGNVKGVTGLCDLNKIM